MCVRLHPDIIVVAEVNNAIRRIDLRSGLSSACANEKLMQNLNSIYISAGRCVEQQVVYKQQMGANNTFIGYGDSTWTNDDYKAYFEENRQFFDLVDEDNMLYKVNIDELCRESTTDSYSRKELYVDEKELSVDEIVKNICKNLLTMNSYSPQVLFDIGICMV